jgi:threonine/homoserine/homoserine lactone efflux protein
VSEALVLAVGVALSPLPIAVLTVILSGRHPRQLGSSFALGWIAGVAGSIVLLIALVGAADTSDEAPLWIAIPELVVGLGFLVLAVHIWRGRRRGEETRAAPRWLDAIDSLTPVRSAGLGLVLAAANPKNLGIALAAAIALAEANVSGGATLAAAIGFAAIGTLGVAVPLGFTAAAPDRSGAALRRFRRWLLEYDAVVLTLVGLAIGAKLAYDGLTAL